MKQAAGASISSEPQMMCQGSERSGDPLLLSDFGKFHFGEVIIRHSKERVPDTRGLRGSRACFPTMFEWSMFLNNASKCQLGVRMGKRNVETPHICQGLKRATNGKAISLLKEKSYIQTMEYSMLRNQLSP